MTENTHYTHSQIGDHTHRGKPGWKNTPCALQYSTDTKSFGDNKIQRQKETRNTITTNHLRKIVTTFLVAPPYVAPLKWSTFHPQQNLRGSLPLPSPSSQLKMAKMPESPRPVIGGLWRRALCLPPPPAGRRLTPRAPLALQACAHRHTRG